MSSLCAFVFEPRSTPLSSSWNIISNLCVYCIWA
jgi:hypothetical protein